AAPPRTAPARPPPAPGGARRCCRGRPRGRRGSARTRRSPPRARAATRRDRRAAGARGRRGPGAGRPRCRSILQVQRERQQYTACTTTAPSLGWRVMDPIRFETHPSRYKHWKLEILGDVARLWMDVREDGGLVPGYQLKLNSYDLGVDIELADA